VKIIDVQQGSDEWLRARLGLPTASNFDRIITPKGLKPSASAVKYLARLCAEWYIGEPLDDYGSGYTERGTGMEAEARDWYAFTTGRDVQQVGLCVTDCGRFGCSPDGLVGDSGGLEIKCPSAEVHMGYLLGGLADEYAMQVQGGLWVTGREWWDLCSYHPTIPPVLVRIDRNPDVMAAFDRHLPAFADLLDAARETLKAKRDEFAGTPAATAEMQLAADRGMPF